MNTMTYKNYTAWIRFDERDGLFVGRLIGLRAIISFHGETVAELQSNLKAAVDDYLEDCAAQGVVPEKPVSGNITLKVPPEVHGAALVAAQVAGKSLNQWAVEVLRDASNN